VPGLLDAVLKDSERIVEDLRAFVEIESPSDDKASTDRFAEFLRGFLPGRLDCRVDIVEEQRFGNHVRMEVGPKDKGKPILMLGHFDTVWPLGTLASMPFRVADGRAFGPGAFDMKSGLVLGIEALSTLQKLQELRAPVVFLFTSDEEVGSPSSRPHIESEASRSRATLVLDLQALNDPSTGTTVNVGVVSGGTRPNVVSAAAVAEVDLRVRTLVEAQRLEEIILGLRPHNPKTRLTVTGGINRPPMERTQGVATMYEIAKKAAAAIGLDLTEASVGGGSDANFVTPLGVPVMDGLGAVGDGAHAVNEHVLLESLAVRSALIAELIRELQSQDEVGGETSGP